MHEFLFFRQTQREVAGRDIVQLPVVRSRVPVAVKQTSSFSVLPVLHLDRKSASPRRPIMRRCA